MVRAIRQTGQPQFHCGTPPPAAAPRTTTRSMTGLLEHFLVWNWKSGEVRFPVLEIYILTLRRWTPARIRPLSGAHSGRRSTCVKREAVAAAYLRAAQAYMLISMPTGTSTIFGVFPAIVSLLLGKGECRPHEIN